MIVPLLDLEGNIWITLPINPAEAPTQMRMAKPDESCPKDAVDLEWYEQHRPELIRCFLLERDDDGDIRYREQPTGADRFPDEQPLSFFMGPLPESLEWLRPHLLKAARIIPDAAPFAWVAGVVVVHCKDLCQEEMVQRCVEIDEAIGATKMWSGGKLIDSDVRLGIYREFIPRTVRAMESALKGRRP